MKKKVLYVIFICLNLFFASCDFLGDDKDSPASSSVLKGITISANPTRTSYFTGEALDLTGITVLAEYTDGSTKTIGKDDITATGYDSTKVDTQTITVAYQEKLASFQVTITAASISSIAIKTSISKDTYYYDDDLDISGLEIEGTYNNGEKRTLDNNSITFTGYDKTDYASAGQTIIATYNNLTTTFDIKRTPFDYTISGDTVTIAAYSSYGPKAVIIPATLAGKTVVAIGDNAFRGRNLTSVMLATSITSIGNSAFQANPTLHGIIFPASVSSIGISAFEACDFITVNIPGGVTDISERAFYGNNNLNQITLNDGLRTIGTSAFKKENNITYYGINVTLNKIPSGVVSIGNDAFNCVGLGVSNAAFNLTIPSSCQSIGTYAFYRCSLRNLTLENGVKTIGNAAFNANSLASVIIPDSVNSIGDHAFRANTSLTSLTLSSTLTSIGTFAFEGCDLRSIDIPAGVTDIPEGAFQTNNNLNQIILHSGLRTIGTNAFRKNNWSAADIYVNLNEIPSTVESIGYGAFALVGLGRNDVNYTLTIPASCQSIGAQAFFNSALRILTLENGVNMIGNEAFFSNYLTSVTVPSSVNIIGTHAFTSNGVLDDTNVNYYSNVDATIPGSIFDVAITKD